MIPGIVAQAASGHSAGDISYSRMCLLRSTSTTASGALIPWQDEIYDFGGWHEGSDTYVTVPEGVSCIRIIGSSGRSGMSPAGSQAIRQRVNSDEAGQGIGAQRTYINGHTGMTNNCVSALLEVTAGDTVDMYCRDGQVGSDDHRTWLFVEEVDPSLKGALVLLGANKTVNNTSPVIDTWDVGAGGYDYGSYFSSGSPDRFTIPASGWYRVTGQIRDTGGSSADQWVSLLLNGGWMPTHVRSSGDKNSASIINYMNLVSPPVYLEAGDYIQISVFSSSSTTLAANAGSWFSIEKVDPNLRKALFYRDESFSAGGGYTPRTIPFNVPVYDDDNFFTPLLPLSDFAIPPEITKYRLIGGVGDNNASGKFEIICQTRQGGITVTPQGVQCGGNSSNAEGMVALTGWVINSGDDSVSFAVSTESNRTIRGDAAGAWFGIEYYLSG